MAKPRIAIFSGPTSTIANSPTLVTSNKGRIPGDHMLSGRFDHLVAQLLYEPVKVKIKKFSAHPLEEEARAAYHDDGKDYYEVELRPEMESTCCHTWRDVPTALLSRRPT